MCVSMALCKRNKNLFQASCMIWATRRKLYVQFPHVRSNTLRGPKTCLCEYSLGNFHAFQQSTQRPYQTQNALLLRWQIQRFIHSWLPQIKINAYPVSGGLQGSMKTICFFLVSLYLKLEGNTSGGSGIPGPLHPSKYCPYCGFYMVDSWGNLSLKYFPKTNVCNNLLQYTVIAYFSHALRVIIYSQSINRSRPSKLCCTYFIKDNYSAPPDWVCSQCVLFLSLWSLCHFLYSFSGLTKKQTNKKQ